MPRIPEYTSQDPMADDDLFVTHNQASGATRSVERVAALRSLPGDAVDTDAVQDEAVTQDKTNFGGGHAAIDTLETTNTSSGADLATPGPSVTVTVPASGKVMIDWGAQLRNSTTAGNRSSVYVQASGANTIAATGNTSRIINHEAGNTTAYNHVSKSVLLTGLTPGSTTFKLTYGSQNTSGFQNRFLRVVPIG